MRQVFSKIGLTPKTSLLLLLATAFFATKLSYSQGDPAKGKALFNANCAACHKLDKKMTGPALRGVTERLEKEWLYKWIRNSSAMIKSGDAYANNIFEEYNGSVMTAFPQLTDQDIDHILAYTSEPPKKQAVAGAVASGDSAGGSKVSSETDNTLVYLIIAILLLIVVISLITVNRKLRQITKANGLELEPQIKSKSIWRAYLENDFLVLTTSIVGFLVFIYFLYAYLMQIGIDQNYQPVQPIHFSHKIHAGDNKIDCKYCHSSARVSKNAGVPALNICMNCHKNISEYNGKEDLAEGYSKAFYDAEIQKLYKAVGWDSDNASYTGNSQPVKWVRIHNLPDFVYFNHSQHVTVGNIECQKCHGPVETMEVAYQYSPLTMAWCIDCHRQSKINVKDNPYYKKIHEQLLEKYGVEQFTEAQMGGTECGKCHY